MNARIVKHLRIRESSELGGMTRYHALCGASGLNNREYTKDMDAMNCVKCNAVAKTRRMRKAAK